jgi:hypothetical protein
MLYDRVLDPLVDEAVHPSKQENVYHSTTGVMYAYDGQHQADSISNNQISFQIPIPSAETIIDSCLLLEMTFEVTVETATANVGDIDINDVDGKILRSFPLNNMIHTSRVTINSHASTHNNSYLKPLQERLLPVQTKLDLMDGCPVWPERESCYRTQFQLENEGYPLVGKGYDAGGTSRRIEGDLYKSHRSFGEVISYTPAAVGTKATATVRYTIREPIMHPLFEVIPGQRGLHNVQSYLGITLQLVTNIENALFYNRFTAANPFPQDTTPADLIYSLSYTDGIPFKMNETRILYRTIEPDDVTIPITRIYPYSKYIYNNKVLETPFTVASNITTPFTYAITGTVLPDTIAIYVARQRLYDQANQLDMTTMRITSLNIKLQNDSNLLANASPYQLYSMSLKNGLKMDWHDWYYGGKCIILIKPGSDFRAFSGMQEFFNLYVTVTAEMVRNTLTANPNDDEPVAEADEGEGIDGIYELVVLQVIPSFLAFNGFLVEDIDGFAMNDVLEVMRSDPDMRDQELDPNKRLGGAFNFKRFFGKVWRGARRYLPIVNHYAQVVSQSTDKPAANYLAHHLNTINDRYGDEPIPGPIVEAAKKSTDGNSGSSLRMGGKARTRELY